MGDGILKEMFIKTNEELEEKEEMKLTGLLEFLSKRKNEVDSK